MGGLRQILNEQVVPSGFCANKTDVGATSNPWDLAYTIGQTIGPNATFSDYISTIPNCPDCPGLHSPKSTLLMPIVLRRLNVQGIGQFNQELEHGSQVGLLL